MDIVHKSKSPNGAALTGQLFQAKPWEGASAPPTPSLPGKNKNKTFPMRGGAIGGFGLRFRVVPNRAERPLQPPRSSVEARWSVKRRGGGS